MAKEIPTGVIVAAYTEEKAAIDAYEYLRDSRTVAKLFYQVAAMVWRAEDGKLHIKEPDDKTATAGIGVGAVLGGMLGTLAGPAGVVLGASAGAAIGGLAAKGDSGIPDERLEEIGEALAPGTSALVVLLFESDVEQTRQALAEQGGKVMVTSLDADLAEHLAAGVSAASMENDEQEDEGKN
jgi:uncharacterized membrane protein